MTAAKFGSSHLSSPHVSSPQSLMVQGTTSDAGKSILVTAFCRILARKGINVVPFKSQNMALNSAVTAEGGEIGRAQAVQAEACFLTPSISMNPVLLKPNSDLGAQVILHGKAIGNMQATEYHQYKPELLKEVVASHHRLRDEFEVVLVEGAGSPAEINLREHDIANMGFAEAVDCPVVICADIDRGGVFAHLYGTYELLSESEKARVKGFIINRFRGDIRLLQSGLDWLEDKTGVPVTGVIPYIHNLHIEAEDAVAQQQTGDNDYQQLRVVVPLYPRASNHTDFDALRMHPQVDCQFLKDPAQFKGADLIILPGSKNVRGDLSWLDGRNTYAKSEHNDAGISDLTWREVIQRHLRLGGKVLGICGGYQMLGNWVHDPDGHESAPGSDKGLGLLDMETTLTGDKILRNVRGFLAADDSVVVSGYEIHTGRSSGPALDIPMFHGLHEQEQQHGEQISNGALLAGSLDLSSSERASLDGARDADDRVMGSYIHGLLDEETTLEYVLRWAGLAQFESFDYLAFRDQQIERLADAVEDAIPLEKLLDLLQMDISAVDQASAKAMREELGEG
ncbi:cobyric acid synthase [Aliamphritea ceti]|uniref:cobyric acid synthase n=1 Tax=Aliamphritea ceti TaxID=1524258 RepID=UPI0021C28C90|nr:cobyric acid synthase [Aliamphritea ceti]